MAHIVAAAVGNTTPDIRVEESKRVGEVSFYIADLRRAKELLGYTPTVDLRTGIAQAVQWQQSYRIHGQ
jgi:UDP-glucose 4-epimerase